MDHESEIKYYYYYYLNPTGNHNSMIWIKLFNYVSVKYNFCIFEMKVMSLSIHGHWCMLFRDSKDIGWIISIQHY